MHRVTDEGVIEVHYDDGGREKMIEEYLRPENAILVGDRVKGNFKKKGRWYPGIIIGKEDHENPNNTRLLVKFDDGAQEWLPTRYVRIFWRKNIKANEDADIERAKERRAKKKDSGNDAKETKKDEKKIVAASECGERSCRSARAAATTSKSEKKETRIKSAHAVMKMAIGRTKIMTPQQPLSLLIANTATAIATATATTFSEDDVEADAPYAHPIQLADGRVMCPVCSRSFANNYNLQRHMPHCPGEYDPDGLIARRRSRNRSRVSETGADGPLPRNHIGLRIECRLQAEKEKAQGISRNPTFWNCKECNAPNLQDDFSCSKCSTRRPREVKAIKRLGPDEMRSPYERSRPMITSTMMTMMMRMKKRVLHSKVRSSGTIVVRT